jgi:dUTP pyrophosphatase
MIIAPKVKVKLLRESAVVPKFMSEGSAGADLFACVDSPVEIAPGDFATIPFGIAIAIPNGFEGEVRPRSGLAKRLGVTVLNAPGTIDSDYRGEVCVILINHGKKTFTVESGNRIAQLLIKPVAGARFIESENLSETDRNGGFGSTGI